LINFGASHPYPHGTRDLARDNFEPKIETTMPLDRSMDDLTERPSGSYDALMWEQTGQRYSRAYYNRLKQSQAVACFCGELIPPVPFKNPECYLVGGNRAKLRRFIYELLGRFDPRPRRSVQWDSFRFWEALAAGCAAFNIDIERYGVDLPVMPENWKHYLGVDFDQVDQFVERIQDEPELLWRVSQEGRQWALAHYSPKAVAQRFLTALGYDELTNFFDQRKRIPVTG
jgi:hypothetical protein